MCPALRIKQGDHIVSHLLQKQMNRHVKNFEKQGIHIEGFFFLIKSANYLRESHFHTSSVALLRLCIWLLINHDEHRAFSWVAIFRGSYNNISFINKIPEIQKCNVIKNFGHYPVRHKTYLKKIFYQLPLKYVYVYTYYWDGPIFFCSFYLFGITLALWPQKWTLLSICSTSLSWCFSLPICTLCWTQTFLFCFVELIFLVHLIEMFPPLLCTYFCSAEVLDKLNDYVFKHWAGLKFFQPKLIKVTLLCKKWGCDVILILCTVVNCLLLLSNPSHGRGLFCNVWGSFILTFWPFKIICIQKGLQLICLYASLVVTGSQLCSLCHFTLFL